jgi:7-dehydrocholesterol reductase
MTAASESSSSQWSSGKGLIPARQVLGPLLLMLITPPFSILYYHTVSQLDGDFLKLARDFYQTGIFRTLYKIWPSAWLPGVWQCVLGFAALQLALMKVLPGPQFLGTLTPHNVRPVYKANGMASFLTTIALLVVGAHFNFLQPARVYDYFGNILSTLNVFALLFCAMLWAKGHVAPSGPDAGTNGSLVQDFYWVRTLCKVSCESEREGEKDVS